ncbi:MAG: carbamate kinase [Euryarchaeota archaeon RBG_13_31_8]|nr:MAG: carbamate kinase [Euryarchaeota archaeon RBG_13_31_8]
MKKKAVIALGGNALIKENQEGTIYEQFANTREICKSIVKIIQDGWDVVVTHGNGPQVGAILLQNDLAKDVTPPMPLGICVAESEGLIGYMVQQCLSNALQKADIDKPVVTLITQVLVDEDDPSFSDPTKPIGPYYAYDEVKEIKKEGYKVKKQPDGWRIVVPSPDPKCIVEGEIIKKMLDDNVVVIASGGGGMPVIEKEGWGLDGLEAVIDKDLAAERIAEAIDAQLLLILTNVEKVYLNYNTSEEKALGKVSLKELKKYYNQGHFLEGSMEPKILAAIRFLESGGKKVIISDVEKGWDAFRGKTGTHITK